MKQKKASPIDRVRHRFPPIRLYRSDIEDIIQLAESRELSVKISNDDYEFEDLDDLKNNLGNKIKKLTISITDPSIILTNLILEIDTDNITLVSSKDDKLISVWHEIKDRLTEQVPWYAVFMKPFRWFFLFLMLFWINSHLEQLPNDFKWISKLWLGIMVISLMLGLVSEVYISKNKGIYLQKEHEVEGFWDRNSEKIYMLVLGAMLGAFFKVIADKLTGR
jgi:hypothetical protein